MTINFYLDFIMPTANKVEEIPFWRDQDEIVISGISCRLPESDNMAELEHNLMNSIDMITADSRRWPPGIGIREYAFLLINDVV